MANSTVSGQVCVLPLSSPYSFLPRLQTYTFAATLLLPLPRGWLFRAALAALTTRTAIFAVDSAVILHGLSKLSGAAGGDAPELTVPAVPLDALVVLEMMGIAVLMALWVLVVSRRGAESAARSLVQGWAVIVAIGAVLIYVAMTKLVHLAADDGSSGNSFSNPGRNATATCQGVWMDEDAVLGTGGWKVIWFERRVGITAVVLASMALLAVVLPRRVAIVLSTGSLSSKPLMDVERHDESEVVIKETGSRSLAGMRPVLWAFGLLLKLALPALAGFIVGSAEMFYFKMATDLPSVESMDSVGQWGGWVAIGVVGMATLINAVRGQTGLRSTGAGIGATGVAVPGEGPEFVTL